MLDAWLVRRVASTTTAIATESRDMSRNPLPLAIIGAGFSGTMTALQLLRVILNLPLLLCERSSVFARGAAYAVGDPIRLLNVRAANMSALPDEPDHFVHWLAEQLAQSPDEIARRIEDSAAGTFVSRDLSGRYLSSLLRRHVSQSEGALPSGEDDLVAVERELLELLPSSGA
jgi:uncharacterized NAD(P)/FAD-binding protein YdhS